MKILSDSIQSVNMIFINKNNMPKKTGKFVYWAPRILSIIFVAFLMLMSLDIFDMKLNFWQTVLGLLMHNLPALVLLVVLIISWKYEIVGGVAFILGDTNFRNRIFYRNFVSDQLAQQKSNLNY